MNEHSPLTLEDLLAEQSRIANFIKIAKEARVAALREELDKLLNEDQSTGEVSTRRRSRSTGASVSKRLYTLKEAALSLGMSTASVRRLVDRGVLKPNRALRTLMFPPAELDRFAGK
jgi:hypothetical protein